MLPINQIIASFAFLYKDGISEQRLLYLLFLLDWESARAFNKTLTNEKWFLKNVFSLPVLVGRMNEYVREFPLISISLRDDKQYFFRFNGRLDQLSKQTDDIQQFISQFHIKTADRLTAELASDVKLSYPKVNTKHIGEIDMVSLAVQEVTEQMDVFQYLESDIDQEPTELDRKWIAWAKKRIADLEKENQKLTTILKKQ